MPWTIADVPKHTSKAKTSAEKKRWVSIANSVLKDCQSKGEKDCDGKAIRIANSKFSEDPKKSKMQEIPNGALRLVQTGEDCFAFAENIGEEKQLKMTVYSGGVIKDHWYWSNLVIDLDGMKFSRSKYPVLENHNTNAKIGFTGKPIVNGSIVLDPKKTKFVNTEESRKFQETSSEGFPYQASMYAVPSSVERIEEGESAEVNGFTFKGPGSIWRKSEFQEASVCVFGWDKQTESSVFSKNEKTEIEFEEIGGGGDEEFDYDEESLNALNEKEVSEVTIENIEQLTKEYPELVKGIQESIKKELEASFSKERDQFKKEIVDKDKLLGDQNDRILKLEKQDIIRTENELTAIADSIWSGKLANSDIPERLYDKVRSMVSYGKFVKDGILDKDTFMKAIDDEVNDWINKGVVSKVMGTGFSLKTETDSGKTQEEKVQEEKDNELAEGLLALAGQKKKDQT